MNNSIYDILPEFPQFELSYETMSYKKVHDANIILAIPEGEKYFAWFTTYKDENVCCLVDFYKKNIQIIATSFNDMLSIGTVFYGTIFKHNDVNCFCIEELYYYKGYPFIENYSVKLQVLKDCFQKNLNQVALTNNFTIFGLPLMDTNFNSLLRDIDLLPYKISQIKFRYLSSKKILFIKYYKPGSSYLTNKTLNQVSNKSLNLAIFKITPQIQTDIYNLFFYNNGLEEFYDIALIPDYNTSVFMNTLFRNIKENRNLDALEESDDDNEFENTQEDKYVFLDRSFKINCQYNHKFKKWVPISVAKKSDRIVSSNLLSPIQN